MEGDVHYDLVDLLITCRTSMSLSESRVTSNPLVIEVSTVFGSLAFKIKINVCQQEQSKIDNNDGQFMVNFTAAVKIHHEVGSQLVQ